MGFGVDTTCFLFATNDVSLSVTNGNGIDWKAFKAWKGVYPTFAGRYFGGGSSYKAGEFKSAYGTTGTDGALQYIFPIQAAQGGGTGNYYGQSYYDVEGTTGYNYGVHDATLLCDSMATALSTTELHVQSSGLVIAYLDVESELHPLKSAYWAGWANTVHTYQLSGTTTKPFVPQFTADIRRRAGNTSFLQTFRRCSITRPNTGHIPMCGVGDCGPQNPSRVVTARLVPM